MGNYAIRQVECVFLALMFSLTLLCKMCTSPHIAALQLYPRLQELGHAELIVDILS